MELVAPEFVFWAAEHVRARFPGGPLSWAFVLDPLGLPPDDQQLGRDLAEKGLSWWKRQIRKSDAGHRMFLYSLMAEGGFPEALLKEPGLYRNVVMGLLAEIEAEGGSTAEPWAEQIASRWTSRLPQTFRSTDITRLLAGLALSLAKLRAMLPDDLPEAATEQWLNKHQPDWVSTIPLRMTSEIAESLIHPALRAERDARPVAAGPLCGRELRRGETGRWHDYLIFRDDGWLPVRHFPDAKDLRLRLLPAGAGFAEGVNYSGAPDGDGWHLRRLGQVARVAVPYPVESPFALSAYADGRLKGEAVIDAGIPDPRETPSFWRAAGVSDGVETDRLVPLTGAGRTREPCLWLLASDDVEPETDAGLALDEIESAPHGFVWRVSGKGVLLVGNRRYRIETKAENDAPEARLFAFGKTLSGWRVDGHIPAYCGDMAIHGQIGAGISRQIPEPELRRIEGRALGAEVVEWVQENETLAQTRLIRFPASMHLDLREEAAGRLAFTAQGLKSSWRLKLSAGEHEAIGEQGDGTARLTLETPGERPGLVRLRLSEPATGRALELQAAWPARSGMLLDPKGIRLDQNRPVSVEALQGWRALAPEGMPSDLELHLKGYRRISLPLAGEVSLASNVPLIQAMLAQGGPDTQVDLSLVVSGRESPRLEIRRYHDLAIVEGRTLRMGIERDAPVVPETALASQLNMARRAILHAASLSSADRAGPIETGASVDLGEYLGEPGGPWLVQSSLEGRVQRAVVWSPSMGPKTSREDRIEAYAEQWRQLAAAPDDLEWNRSWRLVSTARQDGDAGALDQVQALAKAPVSAISLAFRVPRKELPEVLALESASPIFWPILAVSDFAEAVTAEYARQVQKLAPYFDSAEADAEASGALARRIGDILTLRPELAGHLCRALVDSALFNKIMCNRDFQENLKPCLVPAPADSLAEATQEAAKRFDRLPQGVRGLEPYDRPAGFPSFNPYLQSMVDAPLVAAEMAAELRPPPDVEEKLILINLRFVDPIYFDTALPHALSLCLSRTDR